jgi:GT2 family glycosyltransferase
MASVTEDWGPGVAPQPTSAGVEEAAGAIGVDDRVGVVVITRDRRDELLRTLGLLAVLPERPQVVVVDNGSSDGTAESVEARFPEARLVRLDRNEGAAARNRGVALLATPYVAFADDDTWFAPGALARAADVLDRHPDVAVVTGHIVVEPSGHEDPICVELRESPLPRPAGSPGPALLSFLAGASVLRRSAYQDLGGFDRRFFIGGEEQLLAADLAAAGWAMVHVPDVVVHHWPSTARDAHERRRLGIRNTLWFWWLRRPLGPALWRTVQLLRRVPRDRVTLGALGDALAGAPWVLRHRRVVPADVEAGLRLLDRPQATSRARRYVS